MMSKPTRTSILIGSPRGIERSNSAGLSRVMADVWEDAGWSVDWFHAHQAVRSDENWNRLLSSMRCTDLFLLATPLYVDSLPAPVIEALYRLSTASLVLDCKAPTPRMVCLVNCGFVEAEQNFTAQAMARLFCETIGFQWAGGVSIGAGGSLTKRIRGALQQAAEAIRDGREIPDRVTAVTHRLIMPRWLYIAGGNMMWKRQAKAHGVCDKLDAQPYKDG